MCFGAGGSQRRIAEAQRADEVARQARIRAGMKQIAKTFDGEDGSGGFNEEFYRKRQQNYVDYATPQLERQAADARKQLVYALSRTGNSVSSAAIEKNADLTRDIDDQRVAVANEGLNQANATRSQVENIRSNVVSELNATGSDEAAANSALRQAQNINMPAGYSPLGQLFQTFTGALSAIGSNANNNFRGFAGGGRGLFSKPGSGTQRVVGA